MKPNSLSVKKKLIQRPGGSRYPNELMATFGTEVGSYLSISNTDESLILKYYTKTPNVKGILNSTCTLNT